jgi:N-acetylmuramoyl-L-alanine amidase
MRGRRSRQRMNGSPLFLFSPLLWFTSGNALPFLFSPLFALFVLFFLITGSATPLAAQDLGLITNVRTFATDDATRVIISLSRPIRYQLTAEPPTADQQTDTPPTHLDVTFSSATLAPSIPSTLRVGDTLLTSVRSGQTSTVTARISLELTGIGTYRVTDLRSPYQVVIVLRNVTPRPRQEPETQRQERQLPEPERPSRNVEPPLTQRRRDAETRTRDERDPQVALPLPPAPPASNETEDASEPSLSPSPPVTRTSPGRRYRIMLDPGHGGHDPGARGIYEVWEKNVVLAISKRLARKLQERLPVEVMLTRSRDVFISLPGRTARANAAKADLFISIHANSSPNSDTHGIEIYYLNNTNDRATLRLAKLENRSLERGRQGQRGNDLALILSDLIQTGKSEESIALARALQRSLVNQARTHYPEARNLGVKKGPFYVLVGAHMPCVLVETAFLSHAIEGRRLGTSAYQETLAEGLFQGIARFLRDDAAGNL